MSSNGEVAVWHGASTLLHPSSFATAPAIPLNLPAASLRPCPCSHHPALQLFSATELERLVCGNPFLDFDSLQKHARYEGGYSPGERGIWNGVAIL